MKGWLYLLLLIFAPIAFAGPFDPPSTDKSVNLLGIIFSGSVGNLYLGGGASNPILTDLMEKFNFIIVVVGTIVVSYVAILSTINTAHEGSAMGKKWSAVWIPMRSVAGMALLVPGPSTGYSMIQVTVMWIVLQGIGAADSLWNIALEGLANGVSASSGTQISPVILNQLSTNAQNNLVPQIMSMAICQSSLYQMSTSKTLDSGFVQTYGQSISPFYITPTTYSTSTDTKTSSDGSTGTCYSYSGTFYVGVNDNIQTHMDVCGSIPIKANVCPSEYTNVNPPPNSQQLQKDAMNMFMEKVGALDQMFTVVQSIAQGYATGTYASSVTPNVTQQAPGGALYAAAAAYAQTMAGLVVPSGAQYGSDPLLTSQFVTNAITQGEADGWISAGSYYFVFNRTMVSTLFNSALNDSMPGSASAPSCNSGSNCYKNINSQGQANGNAVPDTPGDLLIGLDSTAQQNFIAGNLALGSDYIKNDKPPSTTPLSFSSTSVPTSTGAAIIDAFNGSGAALITEMATLFNTIGCTTSPCAYEDPLLAHSVFGRDIMLAMEGVFLSVFAAVTAIIVSMVAASIIGIFLPGVAFGIASMLLGTLSLTLSVLSWMFPLIAFLWAQGAMLAIYCPLIPYMIFTLGALGWMLTVTEAIIAAPLIALGLVMPAGDELGKLEHALMILANIFLRPMLMIFGFILASGVYRAIVQLIDFGMGAVFQTIAVTTMFSFVIIIVIYITFIISVTNVSFSLIYAVPDRILRWIGGGSESTDVGALKEVKGAAQAASDSVGKGMQEVTGKAAKGAQGMTADVMNAGVQGRGMGTASVMGSALRKAIMGSGSGGGGGGGGGGGTNTGNTGGTNTGNTGGTNTGNTGGTNTGNTGGTNTGNTGGTNTGNTGGTNTGNTGGTNTGNTGGTNTGNTGGTTT